MKLAPVVLAGGIVRLEPIDEAHIPALRELARAEPEIFAYMSTGDMGVAGKLEAFVAHAHAELESGTGLGFAVIDARTSEPVGSTSYYRYEERNRVLEVGRTWYGASARRSAVNTTAKRLLLAHAFESLGLHRVDIRTDARNARSRTAIERIGAVFEGIMRRNVVMFDGYVRDTACYAITDLDWPQVRARLDQMLAACPSSSVPTSNTA